MFLSVKEMELRKIRFDEIFEPGQIDFSGEGSEQGSPLHATGAAELLAQSEGEVRVEGRYTVEMTAKCDRCLGVARASLWMPRSICITGLSLTLRKRKRSSIDEGEAEIGFYEGGGMELEDILREQVLLVLPMQRVCSEGCKGICPVCGRNRNEAGAIAKSQVPTIAGKPSGT